MLEKVGDGLEADGESASERGSTPAIAAKNWVEPAWVESLLNTSLNSIANIWRWSFYGKLDFKVIQAYNL